MNKPFENLPNLDAATIEERINAFKTATMEVLTNGRPVEDVIETIAEFEQNEQFEAAAGAKIAMNDFIKTMCSCGKHGINSIKMDDSETVRMCHDCFDAKWPNLHPRLKDQKETES